MPWLFAALFGISCLSFGYSEIAGYRPQGLHVWRQTDCLAITQRYYAEDRGFFEPAMLYLGPEGSGRTVSDFPLLYYGIGKLWRITGKSELLYRFIILGFLFAGLLALARTLEWLFKDSVWALLVTFWLFSSPFLAYYGFNFLMDIPAFGLGLVGLYAFGKYWRTGRMRHFGWFIAACAFAGLFKISGAIGFIAIGAMLLGEQLRLWRLREGEKLLRRPALQWGLMAIPPLLWFLWYSWAARYNSTYNEHIFLIGVLPLWQMSAEQLNGVMIMVWDTWRGHFLYPMLQWLSLAGAIVPFLFHRFSGTFLKGFLALCLAAFVSFALLFMQVFDHHDYYALNLLVLFPAIWAAALYTLRKRWAGFSGAYYLKLAGLILLIFSLSWAGRRIRDRYESWMAEPHRSEVRAYEDIEPWLQEKGISPEAKVITWPNGVINATLYLMNRRGWTNYGTSISDAEHVSQRIAQGAEYLFLDPGTEGIPEQFRPFIADSLGKYRGIRVFRIDSGKGGN